MFCIFLCIYVRSSEWERIYVQNFYPYHICFFFGWDFPGGNVSLAQSMQPISLAGQIDVICSRCSARTPLPRLVCVSEASCSVAAGTMLLGACRPWHVAAAFMFHPDKACVHEGGGSHALQGVCVRHTPAKDKLRLLPSDTRNAAGVVSINMHSKSSCFCPVHLLSACESLTCTRQWSATKRS